MKKEFTAEPVLASVEFDKLLSWIKEAFDISDKAARIIANWYDEEYIIDDFEEKEDSGDCWRMVQMPQGRCAGGYHRCAQS